MNDVLSDKNKFTIVNWKNDTLLDFAIKQEKHINKVLKKIVESNSTIQKIRKSLKTVGSRPGVIYSSCKLDKAIVENCPPAILTNFVGFEHSYPHTFEILSANFKTFNN